MNPETLPDLQSMSDRELVGHGEKAARVWYSERPRVKAEWTRRGKPHMVRHQEALEAKADRLSSGL